MLSNHDSIFVGSQKLADHPSNLWLTAEKIKVENISKSSNGQRKVANGFLPLGENISKAPNKWSQRKSSLLEMDNEWSTFSRVEVQRNILEKNTKVIKDYMNSLRVPSWYRGISVIQKKAADSLLDSIRDDTEQSTQHRIMDCLTSLGLQPLPTKWQLRKLLPVCGGSDLALLWFLMDWLYQDNEDESKVYSINEQIILSSIAHLDMNSTLRELDRILPAGQAQTQGQDLGKTKNITKPLNRRKKPSFSPYFDKLNRAVQRRTRYTVSERERKAILGRYEYQYKDPAFRIPNERHRWFKDHRTNPADRIACGMIKMEISKLLDNFEAAMVNDVQVQALRRQHEEIENLKQSFDNEMEEIIERASKEMGEEFEWKKLSYSRVMNRLQHDIGKCRQDFHAMAENCRKHCILKTLSCGLQNEKSLAQVLKPVSSESSTFTTLIGCGQLDSEGKPHKASRTCGCVVAQLLKHGDQSVATVLPEMDTLMPCEAGQAIENGDAEAHKHTEDCGCLIGQGDSCTNHCQCCQQKRRALEAATARSSHSFRSTSSLLDFQEKYLSQTSFLRSNTSIRNAYKFSKPEPKYFEAATSTQTYSFDYRKIFEFKENNPEVMRIKIAFIEAVDSDITLLNSLQKQSFIGDNPDQILDEAVNKCFKKIVDEKVRKSGPMQSAENLLDSQGRLNYERDYYDPDDDELMDRMLKDALEVMIKDPRFVLASLPAVHCLPLLREWIRLRYGKRYTRQVLSQSCKDAQPIFRALSNVGLSVRLPSSTDLGSHLVVDYSCRDYLLKKSDFIRKQYYKNINKAILAQSRVIYFAMRPFLCANGPPRNTIFAYMPAHKREIYNFRTWKTDEYQDNRQISLKRLGEVRAERRSLYL